VFYVVYKNNKFKARLTSAGMTSPQLVATTSETGNDYLDVRANKDFDTVLGKYASSAFLVTVNLRILHQLIKHRH